MSTSYKPDGSLDPLMEYSRLFPSNPRWNNIEGNHLTNSEYENLNVFFEEPQPQLTTGITSNQSNFLDRPDQPLPVEQRLDSTSGINDFKASQNQPQAPSDYYTITNLTSNSNNNTQYQCASCCQQRFSPNYYFIPGANMSYHSQYLPPDPPIYVQSKVQNGEETSQCLSPFQLQPSKTPPAPTRLNNPSNLTIHRFMPTFATSQYNGHEFLFWTPDMKNLASSNPCFSQNLVTNEYDLSRKNPMQFIPHPGLPQTSQVNEIDWLQRHVAGNSILVNILTCPPMSKLKKLAPATSSVVSSTSGDAADSLADELSMTSYAKKRKVSRSLTTQGKSKGKETRPKIFKIERFKIGLFEFKAITNGQRNYSAQLRIVFDKRRLIYEFPYTKNANDEAMESSSSSSSSSCSRIESVIYYVISIPFEFVSGLNIDTTTLYVRVNKTPYLFGGTPSKSRVHFQKELSFDPSFGEIHNNALHIINLKLSQVRRLRIALTENDVRFAQMLSAKFNYDPFLYVGELPSPSKENETNI